MSKNEDTKNLKVKPGDKEKDSARKNAKGFLKNHPEILFSSRDLFHNKNGQTVIESVVPRGDLNTEASIMPRTQYDLKEADFQAISKHASKLIDPVIKEYDGRIAMEDALTKAIATLNDGKYANKINASTYNLLLDNMGKS